MGGCTKRRRGRFCDSACIAPDRSQLRALGFPCFPAALFAPALMLKVLWLLIKESVGWAPIPHRAKPALPVSEDGGTARSSIKQQPGDGSEQRPTRPAVEHKEE